MISVVVPVYNVEEYLNQCIESILSQVIVDFEIILVDDGSTDNSGSICDKYSAKDSRVKSIHQENKGVTAARAAGVKNAVGEFIYFVDSDDTIAPDTLYSMFQHMKSDVDIVIYEGNIEKTCTTNEFANYLFNYQLLAVWGKLFRKRLFDDYVFDIPRYFNIGEDFLMNLRMLKNIENKIVICPIKKYLYNTSNPNSVQTASYRNYEYENRMVKEVGKIMDDMDFVENLYSSYLNWQISYLGGMIGFKYKIDFSESWILNLKTQALKFPLNWKGYLTIKSIDFPILRYYFILDKRIRIFLHKLLRR